VSQSSRAWGRTAIVLLCALVVAGSFGVVLRDGWDARARSTELTDREKRGVAYVHALTTVIGQLVQAQTAAVRGSHPDVDKLRQAIDSLGKVDQANGTALSTTQRYRDLSSKAESAFVATGPPRDQFQTWSDVVALALELGRAAGDNAGLTHDTGDDAYYLAQAALVQLPDAMMQAGRAADLASLGGSPTLAGGDAERAAVARYAVASDGEDVTNGLNKAISATESHTLGATIALPLDSFRTAVAAFTPPTAVTGTAPATADMLVNGSKAIFDTALPLTHSLLTQLGRLLDARAAQLDQTRRKQLYAGGGAILAYLVAALAVVVRRQRRTRPRGLVAVVGEPDPVPAAGRDEDQGVREPALAGGAPPIRRGAR
jgi:hypothetical protein